jgi:histidine triad (HIT) family protein
MDDACLFCRLARHELKSNAVFEDAEVYAFHDISPQAPTHVLVVPKRHFASLSAMSPEDVPAASAALAAVPRIAKELGLTDYRVVANTGAGAGQSVFHLHFHLMGGRDFRWPPG